MYWQALNHNNSFYLLTYQLLCTGARYKFIFNTFENKFPLVWRNSFPEIKNPCSCF